MSDQATRIHELMVRASGPAHRRERGPGTVVISGGRPGVGATTLAVNLAAALAQDAHRGVLVDAGNQPSEFTARLWSAADRVLLVTSPDAVAVMDTYALIKTLLSRHSLRQSPTLVVNQAANDSTAADVHRRIDQSCRRFLGISVEFAGGVPSDANAANINRTEHSDPLALVLARLGNQIFGAGVHATLPRMAA